MIVAQPSLSLLHFDAIIFDMDGTLIDSERPIQQAFHDTCHARGLIHQPDVFTSLVGLGMAAGEALLRERLQGETDIDAFSAEWERHTLIRNGAGIPLKPGAHSFLDWLDAQKTPAAIATSTRRARAQLKLDFLGVTTRFAHIVCGDEITNGKPAPDIFLEAARRLGIAPARCLAIEDSANGVRAATAAGMTTIHIPDVVPHSAEIAALGGVYMESMSALHAAMAETLS